MSMPMMTSSSIITDVSSDDKDWSSHTNLAELKALVESSKRGTDMSKAKKGKASEGKPTGPKYEAKVGEREEKAEGRSGKESGREREKTETDNIR